MIVMHPKEKDVGRRSRVKKLAKIMAARALILEALTITIFDSRHFGFHVNLLPTLRKQSSWFFEP